MLPGVRIEDIEAAIEVIECGHFTRAGENLHRAQATVSKSMKRVEDGLGAKLIDRSAHPVRPTKAGTAFRYYVRRAFDSLGRGIHEALRANEPDHAVLQVGYTSYLDLDVLAYLENVGNSPDSGFSHKKHSSSTVEIVASVLSGKWDCGFIVNPATTYGLAVVPIYRDPLGLILANNHPLACKRKVRIEDLRDAPLIVPSKERNPGFRRWLIERCSAADVKPVVTQEVSNPHEAWFLASQHEGVALMPKSTSKNLRKEGTVFRAFLEDDFYAEVQLVFHKEVGSKMLTPFMDAVLGMSERLPHGNLRNGSTRIKNAARPEAKRKKPLLLIRGGSRVRSA